MIKFKTIPVKPTSQSDKVLFNISLPYEHSISGLVYVPLLFVAGANVSNLPKDWQQVVGLTILYLFMWLFLHSKNSLELHRRMVAKPATQLGQKPIKSSLRILSTAPFWYGAKVFSFILGVVVVVKWAIKLLNAI